MLRLIGGERGSGFNKTAAKAWNRLGLTVTIIYGFVFLTCQIIKFSRLPFYFNCNNYTSIFFSLTGIHCLHVLVSIILLLFVLRARTLRN